MSRLSGINVGRVRWGALVASAAFVASIAGIFYAGSLGGADPTSGLAFLLPAFAAAFLGATAIQPGRFNPIGRSIAVFFLVSGITGLQLLGRGELRPAALLRRRADPRGGPVAARAAQGHQGRGRRRSSA